MSNFYFNSEWGWFLQLLKSFIFNFDNNDYVLGITILGISLTWYKEGK